MCEVYSDTNVTQYVKYGLHITTDQTNVTQYVKYGLHITTDQTNVTNM